MKFTNVNKAKLALVLVSVIVMGFCLSFLNRVDFGTDPCTMFNLGVAAKLGISMGSWQALFNGMLFVFVWKYSREQIGWGTLANMFLVGYSYDFFTWLNRFWVPEHLFDSFAVRLLITVPVLALFIVAASVYIAVQLGTAPYDAMPFIFCKINTRIPFKVWRIGWDVCMCVIGVLLGSKAGIVTIIMAFAFGPMISWIQKHVVAKIWKDC